MGMIHDTLRPSAAPHWVTEAKKNTPNPAKFVPVLDWDDTHLWVWVKQPGGKVVGPVQMLHGDVSKYVGKLGWLQFTMEYSAQLDPGAYSSPSDLYPASWQVGDPVPTKVPEKETIEGKYAPPGAQPAAAATAFPPEFTPTGSTDSHGFPTAVDEGSGEVYSLLPDGRIGQWKASEGVYYIVKKEDGEWDIHLDSPIYTPAELKSKPKPEPISTPPEFSLPPNCTIKKVTKTYVTVTTADGKDVKWIKVTDHWIYADDPTKEYTPLQAAEVPPPPPKPTKAKKSALKPQPMAAVPPAPEPPPPQATPTGAPSTLKPKAAPVVSPHPEPAPHLTKHKGQLDVNGFPMVDEVGEGDEDEYLAFDLTLLPDDRVAKWQPKSQNYLLYDYHPHFGFMWSKKAETITADDVKTLMHALHLTVKGGAYHKVSSVGTEPEAEQPMYQAPLPAHTVATEKKDLNGLPVVKTVPSEEEDQQWELSHFPDGRVGKWNPPVKKYQLWTWTSIMGSYNYYPTHPSEYITLKEIQKLQAQLKASTGATTPPATSSVPQPAAKVPSSKGPVIPSPATPEVSTPPKKVSSPSQFGALLPTGEKDDRGYVVGSYHHQKFAILPDGKAGVWSQANGAYVLYAYDALNDEFFNTAALWAPPGFHKSKANVVFPGGKYLASVADNAGTEVLVLPTGQFVGNVSGSTYYVYKADPTKGKLFEPTGETLTAKEIQPLLKTPEYKSLKPLGEVDANGLPLFGANPSGEGDWKQRLTMLPNGDLAVWRSSDKYYRKFEFRPENSVWMPAFPAKAYYLDDIAALYLKAGATPVKPPTVAPSEQSTAPVLPPTLQWTNTYDENDYPIVIYSKTPWKMMTYLPNGKIAMWRKTIKNYVEMSYQEGYSSGEGSGWFPAVPEQLWTLDQVKAMGPAPAVPAASFVIPKLPATLHWMEKNDPNGYPVVQDVEDKKLMSQLPNGEIAQWRGTVHKYLKMSYNEDLAKWVEASPTTFWTLDQVKAMGPAPAAPATVTPVVSPGEQPVVPVLPPTLRWAGEYDVNDYPLVVDKTHPWRKLTYLPNGAIGEWRTTNHRYTEYEYDEELGWVEALPGKSWTLDQVKAMGPAVEPLEVPSASIPEPVPEVPVPTGQLPSPDTLKHLGTGAALGYAGAGAKEIFEDPKTGQKYIFKAAALKGGGAAAPYKIASQEGFATVAGLVRPDAYVPVEAATYKGKIGTLQPELKLASQGNLKGVLPTDLNSQQKADVASEHMLDWLMSQHDSFSANLVMTAEGRIVGVDKEQGWRYVDDPKYPDRLGVDYAPNTANYGEEEPYYNKFWKAFASGKLDFDPSAMMPTLQRIEEIPIPKFIQVLESYANSRPEFKGPEKTYERYRFVKRMLSRRATLRADFEKFITSLYQERTGEADGKFTFMSGWTVPGENEGPKWKEMTLKVRDFALQELGSSALKPHKMNPDWVLVRVSHLEPITKVQEFLAGMGVEPVDSALTENPLFGSNYNSVVVKASDLDKTIKKLVEIKTDPGQKFANYSGQPTYFSEALAPEDAPGAIEEIADAPKMRLGPLGKNFTLDADAVEQQTMSVQRVIDMDGETHYVAHFKLRKPYWLSLSGGKPGSYRWPLGAYDPGKDALVLSSYQSGAFTQPATVYSFPDGDEVAVMMDDAKWSFRGSVYATISGKNANIRAELQKMLAALGIDQKVMKNPSTEDIELYNMAQALWSLDPQAHRKLKSDDFTIPKLKKKLKKVLTDDQIKAVRQVRGTAGRGSPIIPGLWKTLGGGTPEKPVVRFLFWTVETPAQVVGILKSATLGLHERLRAGLGTGLGTSESQDMNTGGSDGLTVRLATEGSRHIGVSHIGTVYHDLKLIIAPEVLDRLDVHIFPQDSYGSTNPNHYNFDGREGLSQAVKTFDQGSSHAGSTEAVFRRGVPSDMIKRVCVPNESYRKSILEGCEKAGITEHNGCPIEDFVVVEDNQDKIYNKYLKPLGY